MTRKWKEIPESRKERMARAFDALTAADDLVYSTHEDQSDTGSRPLRLDDLYRLATRPDLAFSPAVSQELRENPELRRELALIVDQLSIAHFPIAAAADTGDGIDRESGDFAIKLRPTQRRADQVYLLVEQRAGSDAPAPQKLLARYPDGSLVSIALPAPVEGVIQLLLAADDGIVAAVADRNTVLDIL